MTPEELKIRQLEVDLLNAKTEIDSLHLINNKLGYSTKLLSEFHMSQDDKDSIANAIDEATSVGDVKKVHDYYHKTLFNKVLEDSPDFQMSQAFKDNIRHYFAVALGYDLVSTLQDDFNIIADYYKFENKILSTPDANLRKPMQDSLLKDKRPYALDAINRIIDVLNSFNEVQEEEYEEGQ